MNHEFLIRTNEEEGWVNIGCKCGYLLDNVQARTFAEVLTFLMNHVLEVVNEEETTK